MHIQAGTKKHAVRAADFGFNKVQTTLAAQFSNWFWKKLVSQIIRILTKINSYI